MLKKNNLFAAILLGYTASAQANIVDFSGDICSANSNGTGALIACSDSGYINQHYGDAAHVDITYKDLINAGSSLSWWGTDYNNLVGVAWGGVSDGTGSSLNIIEIAPVGNYIITLNKFDVGAYFQTQKITNIRILELLTGNVLRNYAAQTVGIGNTATPFTPGVSSANGIAIEWKDSAYNVGLDNIDFSVSLIPEPSTYALMGLGLAGMWRRARGKFSNGH